MIANAIAVALFHRERTGEGTDITIAMTEVMRSYLLVEHGASAIPEPPLGTSGYARILTPERRPHATADGMINVLPYDQTHYEAIFRLGGREDLIGDPRTLTRRSRIDNGGALYREVATILLQRTTDEWLEVLRAADIPSSRVGTVDDLIVGLPIADHPHGGRYRVTPPLTGSAATLDVVRRPAPLHGEHNREVLAEVGYSDCGYRRPRTRRCAVCRSDLIPATPATVGFVTEVPIGRPRTVVADLPAYRPGKGAAQAEAEHGITGAIKLASNENPDPPIDPILAAIDAAARSANLYADHRATVVSERLAAKLGVTVEQVTVGNGSVGLLQQLASATSIRATRWSIPWRSFEVYPVFTHLMNGVRVQVPFVADAGFDVEAVAAAVTDRTKLVFLATPNNPTGTALTTAELRVVLDRDPGA